MDKEQEDMLNKMFFTEGGILKGKFEDNADKKAALHKFTLHLIDKYHIKTIKGTKRREIFIYKDGVYISGEEIIKKDIRDTLEELSTNHLNKEIIEAIKDLTPIDRDKFTVETNILNFNNGVFDINTQVFSGHDPKYLFLTKIPVDYVAGLNCSKIKQFLDAVLDDEQIKIVQEWFGYVLYRSYFIKKAIVCVGDGDTGKTTLLSLFSSFLGLQNVCGVSLQKISSDKFSVANLYSKHINIYDELSFKDINDNGAFKMVTGGGIITGERKFGDQFQFKNYAKLTFACNKVPDVRDAHDDAYFNRWIVIQFNYPVEEEDKDKQLIYKMTTPEELSGLLNFSLEGLTRLLKNERFSYDKKPEEIKLEMQCSGSSIADFAFNCLERSDNDWISKDDMYKAYIDYTQSKGIPSDTIQTLGRRLRKYANYITDSKPMDSTSGKQITSWMGVRFKENPKPSVAKKEEEKDPFEIFNNIS